MGMGGDGEERIPLHSLTLITRVPPSGNNTEMMLCLSPSQSFETGSSILTLLLLLVDAVCFVHLTVAQHDHCIIQRRSTFS